jgi:RNA polymerase-binding transcription factor DksA
MEEREAHQILDGEREDTRFRLASMRAEFDAIVTGSADANVDDEHDPEGSTVAFERAQLAALMAVADGYLAELEDAALRLEAGGYGICEACGGVISDDRLRARPATRTCVLCTVSRKARRVGERPS